MSRGRWVCLLLLPVALLGAAWCLATVAFWGGDRVMLAWLRRGR